MRRTIQRRIVGAACFLLATLLLILSLSAQISLKKAYTELIGLQDEREELERERQILIVRLAERESLAEIERRAEEDLGMSRCRADQVVVLEEEDAAYR